MGMIVKDTANLESVDSRASKYNWLRIHPEKKKTFSLCQSGQDCTKMASRRQRAQLVVLQPALLSQLADHEALVLHRTSRLTFQAVIFFYKERTLGHIS